MSSQIHEKYAHDLGHDVHSLDKTVLETMIDMQHELNITTIAICAEYKPTSHLCQTFNEQPLTS